MQASNLRGGVDRTNGIRELTGYFYAYGDTPPVFPNDLFDLQFTLDGVGGVQVADSGGGVRCRAIEIIVEPYDPEKKNLVQYIVYFGGAGNDFTTWSPSTNNAWPIYYPTKGLGLQLAYWDGSQLQWDTLCYVAGMKLRIEALADADYSSCLNGIAYFPPGDIDWSLTVSQRTNLWPLPVSPNVSPPMLAYSGGHQAPPSIPNANPGSVNATGAGDLVWPDLDAIVGVRMNTQLNSDTTVKAFWQLLYAMCDRKGGTFDHKTKLPLTVEYLLEKCTSMPSKASWDVGSITTPGSVTKWPT